MGDKVWTAGDLERMTPAERDAVFDSSVVTDLDAVPTAFLERVRRRAAERIEEAESHKS